MRVDSSRAAWLSLLLLAVALSGCSEEAPKALEAELPTDAIDSGDGRDLRRDLTAADRIPGPAWKVGDWFGHHIFFGTEDTEGTHINVVVTEDRGDSWYVVSEDAEVSMYEAMMDIPITGSLAKGDLDTTAFGGAWEVYDFPLEHNKTWKGVLTMDVDWSFDLTYTATYQESFQTTAGNRPGFLVTGVDGDGRVVVETDYVPAIGWYTQFVAYDPESEDPEDFVFRSISMGTGSDWTGEYVEYEAETVFEMDHFFSPVAPGSTPAHTEGFGMSDGATHLAGYLYSYAGGGGSALRLIDPAGTVQVEQTSTHTPEGADPDAWGGAGTGDFYVLDAQPGDWNLAWGGPGVVSGFGGKLWSLTERPGSLGGAADGASG